MSQATRWIAILLPWLVCGAVNAAPTPQKSEHVFVVGADVDAKGQVTQTQPDADVAKPIATVLDEALRHWRFMPAQKDGKAVPVHTFIKAKLEALPAANDTYTLRISFLGQGPKWQPPTPHYPHDAQLCESCFVAISGLLNPDGRTSIIEAKGDQPFVKAVSTEFLRTTGTPEIVAGQPVAAHIHSFFAFHIEVTGRTTGFFEHGTYNLTHSSNEEKAPHSPAESKEGDNDSRRTEPPISSVLQPSSVEPVILQP